MQVLIINVGFMHMIWTSVMNIVKHPNLLVPLIFRSWHMSANGLSFPKTLKEAILVYVTMTTLLEARQDIIHYYPARACAARGKVISRGWWVVGGGGVHITVKRKKVFNAI